MVDLSGQYNGGVPELEEITGLRGRDVTGLSWRTTSYDDGYAAYSGADFIVAELDGVSEAIVWPES